MKGFRLRFSTWFLVFAVVLYPFPFDWLPELAAWMGFDGSLVGGVLQFVEAAVVLLALASATGLLAYSLWKRRPYRQFACEALVALCLLAFLPFY